MFRKHDDYMICLGSMMSYMMFKKHDALYDMFRKHDDFYDMICLGSIMTFIKFTTTRTKIPSNRLLDALNPAITCKKLSIILYHAL